MPGIPTCMNPDAEGKTGGFAGAVGKPGADFKRQFAAGSCIFRMPGITTRRSDDGRIRCAAAVLKKLGRVRTSRKDRRD